MSKCGADTEANDLMQTLLEGDDFVVPTVDLDGDQFKLPTDPNSALYKTVTPITPEEFTEKSITGSGFFDVLMAGAAAQLVGEFKANRITGNEYTKAYISVIQFAFQTAAQLLLGRDQAFWESQKAQIDAINGIVELASAKVKYAELQIEAKTTKANYALTKLKLSTEEMNYCVAQYQLDALMPAQLAQTEAQTALISSQKAVEDYQLSDILPAQKAQTSAQTDLIESQKAEEDYKTNYLMPSQMRQVDAQTALVTSQKSEADYQVSSVLPAEVAKTQADTQLTNSQKTGQDYQNSTLLPDQHSLLTEQINVQHAQTHDTNLDGSPVTGTLGSQKSLYLQQIESYKRDAEVKAAKLWMDGWSVMRTTDEGLDPPTEMSNDVINTVLTSVANANGFTS